MKNAGWWGVVLGVMVVSQAYADHIFVSGDVTGTWAVDTVFVTGDVRVPQGETLMIEPGVKVLFQGWFSLVVDTNAILQANGTVADSILFDSLWPDSVWHGIKFTFASHTSRLEYCHITNCSNPGGMGGGIYGENTNMTIEHCLIDNCEAYYGGGICLVTSPALIHGNTIAYNMAFGMYSKGGGIYCLNSNASIEYNNILHNSAHTYSSYATRGGGIYCQGMNPVISNNVISQNTTYSGWGPGGGIYCYNASADIVGNTISENIGSGIFCDHYSNSNITGNVLVHNFARDGGAGIYCENSSPNIFSNLIYSNFSDTVDSWGAGVLLDFYSNPTIINNTIVANQAPYCGGLLCMGSNPTFINSILWGNDPPQIVQINALPVVTYSDIEGGWPGEGNINSDPLFLPGPLSDYQLSPGSPCIDAGNPATQYNDPEDPANPGFALWPALGTIRNDMGAYGGSGASGWVGIVNNPPVAQPTEFKLSQNFPNPFNAATVISFELRVPSFVILSVYDISGRRVNTVINGWRAAGRHEATFDGSELSSGVYIYRLEAGEYSATGKMVLLK